MQLSAYLLANNLTYGEFAAQIGVSNASVVHKYAKGRIPRDRAVMAAIVRETSGQVQPSDFFAPAGQ